MNFNKVIIMGNLTKEPELKYLPSGNPVCNFSIAVNEKYKKGNETVDNTSYFDIAVFSKQAESCDKYLSKGRPVLIEGKLQQRRWEAQDGTKRSKIEIVASSVIFLGSGEKKQEDNCDNASDDDDLPF